ncbi:MAG: hypothetical protein ABL859_10915, partial [Methylotenera sp.]
MFIIALVVLSASRFGLVLWKYDRVLATGQLTALFLQGSDNKAGETELNWLHQELASISANHQQAILLIQDTGVQNNHGNITLNDNHWDSACFARFKAELTQYAAIIKTVTTTTQATAQEQVSISLQNKNVPIKANNPSNT